MKNISQDLKENVFLKKDCLAKVKTQLKEDFIGINKVVDDLIDSFSYWYFFPELQKKPVIINLWGLTGVGKTSLISSLVTLLDYNKRFFRFNLSESEWDIKQTLTEIYENKTSSDFILLLDEFQHVRTIDEDGKERSSKYQFIWDLLDNGKVQITSYSMRLGELTDLMVKLRKLLQMGIEVKDGLVISNEKIFMEEFGIIRRPNRRASAMTMTNPDLNFVPSYYYDILFEQYREKFTLQIEVKEYLMTLGGWQTIEFLKKVITTAVAPKYLDCTKAMVFIIGNLDEAYQMTTNFDTDISADEFHEESLKISLPDIKNALKERFRSEQIARLGNNHIIYPALDSTSFYKIIDLELEKANKEMISEFGIRLTYDNSIREIIYNEGVYPTQGTRPLFSTIHSIINTQIPKIIFRLLNHTRKIDTVNISYYNEELTFKLRCNGKTISTFSEHLVLNLENLRVCKQDDMQAITAVHESGHAILSAILLRIIPEVIYSVTTSTETEGFIYSKFKHKYIAKNELINRIAFLLGGLAAERIVFGDEKITAGSSSDIKKATHFVCSMVKSCGMGEVPAAFQQKDPATNTYLNDTDSAVNDDVKRLIQTGYEKAEEILMKQQPLLLRMSEYLSNKRGMKKDTIREYVRKYSNNFNGSELIENGDQLFYRSHLKMMVKSLESKDRKPVEKEVGFGFSLNRE